MAVKKKRRTSAKRKKPVKKAKRRVALAKRRPVKRAKRKPTRRKLVKQVERSSVERTLTGKRKRRRSAGRRRRVVMAGPVRRRRVGAKGGGSKLLIGLAIGAAAIYFLTRRTATTPIYPGGGQLPALLNTNNYTRNSQAQDVVNYAIAAGLAIDAISKLIDKLNNSSDAQVQSIHETVHTTGDVGVYV
jgi:hypothetical protein